MAGDSGVNFPKRESQVATGYGWLAILQVFVNLAFSSSPDCCFLSIPDRFWFVVSYNLTFPMLLDIRISLEELLS